MLSMLYATMVLCVLSSCEATRHDAGTGYMLREADLQHNQALV
jgi:hypothetical protein